jgi:uncharacterized protein (DUF3820 family)
MNAIQTEHRLPFGRHKDKPMAEVPDGYLLWTLRDCKLSSGLRQTVADELQRRGIDAPAPPIVHPPDCQRCHSGMYRVDWMEDRRGQRRIRATCSCGRYLCFLPIVEPWIFCANENASPAPVLDVLTQLEDLGVELQSDGRKVWVAGADDRRVPAELHVTIRQCAYQLARLLGRRGA